MVSGAPGLLMSTVHVFRTQNIESRWTYSSEGGKAMYIVILFSEEHDIWNFIFNYQLWVNAVHDPYF